MFNLKTLCLFAITFLANQCYCTFDLSKAIFDTVPSGLTTDEVISRFNYPFARYTVKTADGFTIQLYNVPPKTKMRRKKVVLLLPGLYCQAYFYFILPTKSLGFVLPNKGYDTWVANFRGQSESETGPHPDSLGPKGNDWDFSMDELAKYDTPALIDFVLSKTGASRLTIIGHSMGNTAALMTLAEKPEYNKKVELMVALGPAVYVTPHSGAGWLFVDNPFAGSGYLFYNFLNNFQRLVVSGGQVRALGKIFCQQNGRYLALCRLGTDAILGTDPHIAKNVLAVLISHVSSASFKMHYQYIQHTTTGRFAKYDYGPAKNLIHYKQPVAPLYDLRSITTPCALISGWDDRFNTIYNVRYLMRNIPKVVLNHVIPEFNFNHMSFVAAQNIAELVNSHIYDLLEEDHAPATPMELLRTKLLTPSPDSLVSTISRKLQHKVDKTVANSYDWYGLSTGKNNPAL